MVCSAFFHGFQVGRLLRYYTDPSSCTFSPVDRWTFENVRSNYCTVRRPFPSPPIEIFRHGNPPVSTTGKTIQDTHHHRDGETLPGRSTVCTVTAKYGRPEQLHARAAGHGGSHYGRYCTVQRVAGLSTNSPFRPTHPIEGPLPALSPITGLRLCLTSLAYQTLASARATSLPSAYTRSLKPDPIECVDKQTHTLLVSIHL